MSSRTLIFAAFATVLASPACAATYLIKLGGTAGPVLENDLFGGEDVSGLPFSATFTLTYPTEGMYEAHSPDARNISGSGDGNPIKGSVTIGQYQYDFGEFGAVRIWNDYFVEELGPFHPPIDAIYINAGDEEYNLSFSVFADNGKALNSLELPKSLHYTLKPEDHFTLPIASGLFLPFTDEPIVGMEPAFISWNEIGQPIPEPATWMLLIFGFAAFGARTRGNRATISQLMR